MLLKEQIVPLTLSLIVALTSILVYNEESFQIELEWSANLEKWFTKGKYFSYKGHKIFYVFEKIEEDTVVKPAIVLLHGFPTSSFDFFRIWNQFTDKSHQTDLNQLHNKVRTNSILTFDYLGYGFSEKPYNYPYSIFDMADMVEQLILHLKIESVILVAHDISDSVAQEILRRDNLKTTNHYQIEKCVLLNGGIMTSIYKPRLSQYLVRNEYLGPVFCSKYLFRFMFFRIGFSQLFGEFNPPSKSELYDFYLGIKYNNGMRTMPLTIGYMNEREEYGNIWYDALNETSLPVLFIYGPADPINPRDSFPAKLRLDLPRVKLRILSDMVGHYPHHEDSFTVFQLIKNFL